MSISNRKLFFIALIFGIATMLLIYFYLGRVEEERKVVEPTQEVVIAKVTIQPKTKITKDMVELKDLKIGTVPPSAYSSIDEVVGQITKDNIYSGEPIIHERIADEQYRKNHMTYSVPSGHRAITLQYNPVMGVGGFIQPGDYVDVIGTYDEKTSPYNIDTSKLILQEVLVLAVGTNTGIDLEQKSNTDILTITLAVTPQEAEKLTFTEEKASIKLLLRPLNETTGSSTFGTTKDNIFIPQQ